MKRQFKVSRYKTLLKLCFKVARHDYNTENKLFSIFKVEDLFITHYTFFETQYCNAIILLSFNFLSIIDNTTKKIIIFNLIIY